MSSRNALDVTQDLTTLRLIRAAQAVQSIGQIPTDSGRTLVNLARAVRQAVEAREPELRDAALDGIDRLVKADDETKHIEAQLAVIRRRAEAVRKGSL
jgi:hypothetical protein